MIASIALIAMQALQAPVVHGSMEPSFVAEMNQGGAAAIKLKITIASDGSPIACDTAFRNGPASNGAKLCYQLMRSARFSPATDARSMPTPGVVYVWSQWQRGKWLGSTAPDWDPVDLALEVERMPTGVPEMTTFRLNLLIDTTGKVADCAAGSPVYAHFGEPLCDASSALRGMVVRDGRGTPVASVQPVRIRLASKSFMDQMIKGLR